MEDMRPIGEMLKTPPRPAEALSRQEASKATDNESKFFTPEQAKRRGLSWKYDPPPTGKCEFCGKELPPRGFAIGASVVWIPTQTRCDCEEAQKYWAEHDRQERQKEEQERQEQERQQMQERINRLLGQSGIKKRFRERTFPNFRCDTPGRKKCYEIAKEYADHFAYHRANGDGLYIEGTNGTGKTHLAAAIALQLINRGIPVICKTSGDLLLDIKRAYDSEYVSESEILETYKDVDLLIIDDLGKEQCSDWSMSTLYSILNDRYEDMKPTIITTNYNADDLATALTPKGSDNTKAVAIISRLRETSTVMTMAWNDIRGAKGGTT